MKKLVTIVIFCGILLKSISSEVFAEEDFSNFRANPSSFVTMKLPTGDSVKAIAGAAVGFSIIGDVIQKITQPDELHITDMSPFNSWFHTPNQLLMPGYYVIKNPYVPYTITNRESDRWCAILTMNSPYVNSVKPVYEVTDPDTVGLSQNIPWSQELYTHAQLFGSKWAGLRKEANENGTLDFNMPEHIQPPITEETCGANDLNVERTPIELGTTSRAVFGEGASIESTIIDSIASFIEEGLESIGIKMELRLTGVKMISNTPILTQLGGSGYIDRELGREVAQRTKTPRDGAFASNIPFLAQQNPTGWAGTPNIVRIDGSVDRDISYINPESAINRTYESLQQGACPIYPYQVLQGKGPVQEAFKIGGVIPTECGPQTEEAQCEEADTYDEILKKLPNAINAVCSKYENNLPIISEDECRGMMNEIFNIEIRNDPEWSGANYRCEHRSDSTAAGPFQIIDETYHIVTCDNNPAEDMPDDLTQCKTTDEQLSRCTTEDAAELAMRVILNYSDCKNVGTIGTTAELYESLCNYGTGVGVPQDHLDGKTYCEWIFDVVGIPKP